MENNQYGYPIYIDWKFDTIMQMIKSIDGYENINFSFEFHQIHEHFSIPDTYECNGGIKDGNIWIVKYHRRFSHADRSEAHILALTSVQEELITTVWKLAIDKLKQKNL